MPRKYRHIKDYEKELIEYIQQGHTLRETGEKFGFAYKEMSRRGNPYDNALAENFFSILKTECIHRAAHKILCK